METTETLTENGRTVFTWEDGEIVSAICFLPNGTTLESENSAEAISWAEMDR